MVIPLKVIFVQGNTQDVNLDGLQDIDTLVFWTAATATGQLVDQNGTVVIQPFILNNTGSGTGSYLGTITTDFSVSVGEGYVLVLDAQQSGVVFHLELPAAMTIRKYR